ncbi:MAG: hypothetical protein HYW47_07430 [Deltaproteobacteria bacterium]|nr:hypothetical protein [Deltaproteobacteria bacterium]
MKIKSFITMLLVAGLLATGCGPNTNDIQSVPYMGDTAYLPNSNPNTQPNLSGNFASPQSNYNWNTNYSHNSSYTSQNGWNMGMPGSGFGYLPPFGMMQPNFPGYNDTLVNIQIQKNPISGRDMWSGYLKY